MRRAVDKVGGPTRLASTGVASLASITKWSLAATREESTLSGGKAETLAKALGYESFDDFEADWRSTPVLPYPRKPNYAMAKLEQDSARRRDIDARPTGGINIFRWNLKSQRCCSGRCRSIPVGRDQTSK